MRLLVALGGGAILTGVIVVVLLLTIWRDEAQQEIGRRLIEAAVSPEKRVLLGLAADLERQNTERFTIACADVDTLGGGWTPDEIVRAFRLPEGDWQVERRGQARGIGYVFLYDPGGEGARRPFSANWYEAPVRDVAITCLIPER